MYSKVPVRNDEGKAPVVIGCTSGESGRPAPKEGDVIHGGPWDGFEVVSVYTRAQALEDGVLVDVTPLAKMAGFRLHTVITCGVLEAIKSEVRKEFADVMPFVEEGPVYRAAIGDVLAALHAQIRKDLAAGKNTPESHFRFGQTELWALTGPGDQGEAVLTVMLEGED
jgi:hypothetical protein